MPHLSAVERAAQYVEDVMSGKEPACIFVKQAVERHVRDMERARSGDFRYVYDVAKAERCAKVIELLPHTKGKWAKDGQLLTLGNWQCFILCSVFGWVDRKSGMRRFREVTIIVPRKNGKSALTSGVGIYMLAFDGEHGAEVYANATTEKQAWEVFKPARLMVLGTPKLRISKGIEVNANNMSVAATASKFETVIGKPGDGASPSLGIVDEYHEHQTADAHDTMQTGMGAREQPILWVITTAGDNIAGPCYDKQRALQDILSGAVDDERTFGIIYTVDKDDDWTDPAVLRKANPNYGVSVDIEYLEAQQAAAIRNPRNQARFKTKHLNIWVQSRDAYFNSQAWLSCPSAPPIETLAGTSCRIALDLASKVDIAALEIVFPQPDGHYFRYGKSYLPSDTVEDKANAQYQAWRDAGTLDVTDGNVIDMEHIEDDVLGFCEMFKVEDVSFDPFQGTYLSTRLLKEGVKMVEYRMVVATMSEPMKSLDALIISGKLHHNCDATHPMTWQMGNVVAIHDRKDNVYPNKESAAKKIDNPVALIMALGRCLEPAEEESAYNGKGLLVI